MASPAQDDAMDTGTDVADTVVNHSGVVSQGSTVRPNANVADDSSQDVHASKTIDGLPDLASLSIEVNISSHCPNCANVNVIILRFTL